MKYADKLTDFRPAHTNLSSTLADAHVLSPGEARHKWSYLSELLATQLAPMLALRLPEPGTALQSWSSGVVSAGLNDR